jgi:glycosyltransferase involved in cell wall biosynthesis
MSHIALVIPGLDRIGGAEQQAILLANGLRERGWRVTMIALCGKGGAAATELRGAGVAFVSLEMRKGLADPRGWIRYNRWLWRERPDVVHAHLPHATWLARWSRLLAPPSVVIDTLHSSHPGGIGRKIGYRFSRWLPDRVTAVSCATAESHLAAGMVTTGQLTVIANGVDIDAWRPHEESRAAARREMGLTDEFLWLAVGRLETIKDFPSLLRAIARVPEKARFVVLGAGPLHDELVDMTARLSLEQRVCFAGFEPNVQRWMQIADGFVLASRYEGLPMALLEAGACGVPVVATNVPGTREVVVNGDTGWLADAEDAGNLPAAMTKLMAAPAAERRVMGAHARTRVSELFSLQRVLDQWETLYTGLLARNAERRRTGSSARESRTRRSASSA